MAVVGRGRRSSHAFALIALVTLVLVGAGVSPRAGYAAPVARVAPGTAADALAALMSGPVQDSLFGRSGKLRVRFVGSESHHGFAIPLLQRLFGDTAVERPGVYAVADSAVGGRFAFVTMRPFAAKVNGWLGSYHIGFWPGELGGLFTTAYAQPQGFIEVTPDNQDLQVSEHFRLRDFLTKDQREVWPKYLVLREELVDKLELTIQELRSQGVSVRRMSVMSGFRTPQYNANGGETSGRAKQSRHMYGDAADVFVDNNNDGRMDDLNRDGRVDSRDARVILRAVERVERRYPELSGGVGVYRATRAHGPFAHVDVRGRAARWGRI